MHTSIRRRESGAFNIVTALFVLLVVGVVYAAYVYVPPWMRNRRVHQAMKEAGHQAWRSDDDALRKIILDRTSRLWPDAASQGGKVPEIRSGMIDIDRDRVAGKATIKVSYEMVIDLPFLDRQRSLRFDNRVEASTNPPADEKPSEFMQWLTQ